jgi:N-acetylglucosamine malate deacetylase 1
MIKRTVCCILFMLLAVGFRTAIAQTSSDSKKLNILVIGAHPDDPEEAGGTMAKYIMMGHKVRLLSLTNGDAGHFRMGGGSLAVRRQKEAQCAGKVIGAEYVVLDNHDGELLPTLENRREIIRQIREMQADIVFTPRPDDYHPDHRNTALLVRDAAYMVTVPNVVAHVPHLKKNPVFMYLYDNFTRPTPFRADIVVDIGDTVEKKIDMYHCHESQMYEWLPYNGGYLDKIPEGNEARRAMLAERQKNSYRQLADKYRSRLNELYGEAVGSKVRFAEAFEVSEYGSQVNEKNRKTLFPFLP